MTKSFKKYFDDFFQMWSVDEESPWNIQSLYDLQFFNCPSCDYKDYSKQEFVDHAYNSHPEAYSYLNNINDGSTDDVLIPNDDSILDFKTELDTDISNPYTGLDVKIEEFDDMGMNENVKSDDPKLSFNNSYVAIELKDFKNDAYCELCETYFCDNKSLEDHNTMEHDIKIEPNDNKDQNNNCNHCDLTFDDPESKKQHFISHHRDQLDHKCEHCDNAFITKKELISHYNAEHEDLKLFKCIECEELFGTSKKLISHMKHNKKSHKKFICKSCGKSFSYASTLKHHNYTVHEGHKDYKCETCGKAFSHFSNLSKHINIVHEGQKDYKCETCGKLYPDSSTLKRHFLIIHEGRKDYKCESCGKEFYHSSGLTKHIKRIHEAVESRNRSKIKCEKCGKLFTKTFYPKHIIRKHSPKIKCEICGKLYRHTFYPKHYERWHQEGSYMCEHCAKVCKSKYLLTAHVRIHGENTHTACKICGKMLAKVSMATHISSVHEKNKKWICTTCGKGFSVKGSMEIHEQFMHGGIKKHKCPFPKCERAFHQNSDMVKHLKSVHERRKDYQCIECGKAFGTSRNIKRHRETVHELVKKFKCHLCTNAYGQSHELKKHYINFHKQIIPKFKTISEFQKEMTAHDSDI